MKDLLGGKGANLAEMASLGLPVPPGFTITTEVCTAYYANGRKLPDGLEAGGGGGARRRSASAVGATLRRRDIAAARLGALRRARLDARHDGHHPQPRPQRRDGEGPRRQVRQRALRLRQLSPLHPDVRRRRARRRSRRVRGHPRQPQEPQRLLARHRPRRRRLAGGDRRLQGGGRARDRQAVPAGHHRAAVGRDRRRVRLLAERSAPSPTAACTTSPTAGARPSTCRPWCSATSATARPPASPSRAIPSTGEKRDLRRVPDQRAGRGRRRRHPHAAAADRGRAQGGGREAAVARSADARHLSPSSTTVFAELETHYRDMQDIEFTIQDGKLWMLQTRTGKRTAEGRAQDRRRPGRRRRDHAGRRRCCASMPAALDQLLHPTIDPDAEKHVLATRPAGLAGRRLGRDRVRRRRGRDAERPGPRGHPGARRDQPRGHPRHARRRRHPHRARRHDQPRRRRRARHGPALRVRRRRAAHRRQGRHHDGRRRRPSARATSSPSTAPRARCSRAA